MSTLWFFWGQEHLTFLRWITLYSASKVQDDIVLVLRKYPIRPEVTWKEKQDFQIESSGKNWLSEVDRLQVKKVWLEDIAPDIAKLKAPDIQTADLLRWWLLAEQGGIVADMDIVFLKPPPKIEKDVEVVVFTGHPKPGYVPVSYMQGRPCWYWKMAFDNALKLYLPNRYESCGSEVLTVRVSPGLSERIVFPWAGKHPWSRWHDWLFQSAEWPEIPEDCIGIHWYAGHNQKWNQKIQNEEDLGPEGVPNGAIPWSIRKVMIE